MKNHDTPLTSVHNDLLNRRGFAQNLANAILNLEVGEEGFVAALTGPWGSGKSTTINFITHYLTQIEIQNHLSTTGKQYTIEELDNISLSYKKFEKEIKKSRHNNIMICEKEYVLEIISEHIEEKEISSDVYEYALCIHKNSIPQKTFTINFSPWHFSSTMELTIAILNEISSVIGIEFGKKSGDYIARYTKEIFKAAASTAAASVGISGINYIISKISEEEPTSITMSKRILSDELKNHKDKKILFILDDLDRLSPEEASSVISAIKGITKLPNILYLLSYDRNEFNRIVSLSINAPDQSNYGERFMEKIVQYSKDLPLPTTSQVRRIFEEEIVKIIDSMEIFPNQNRLSTAWEFIIRHYINTPRDAKRLANNYSVALHSLHRNTDPIDLLVLITLETFEARVYQRLRQYIRQ